MTRRRSRTKAVDVAEPLHVHSTNVWDSLYLLPWMDDSFHGYMSVSMVLSVYVEDETATMYPSLDLRLSLDHPEADRVWDSLMTEVGRHTYGEPTTSSFKIARSSWSWSDHDPWKVRGLVEDDLCEALKKHGFKVNLASPVVAPPVVTTTYVIEKLVMRLPHLMMRARTISGSEIPAEREDMPRQGCNVPEQVLHRIDETRTMFGLMAWHRRRRRSFNKLLRALTKVRGVRCSWETGDR